MKNRLNNKVALVTGGNSGIGKETVQRFLEEGATVYFTGRNRKTIEETVSSLGNEKVTGIRSDSNDASGLIQVLKRIQKEQGRLDVLFLNAGIAELWLVEHEVFALLDVVYGSGTTPLQAAAAAAGWRIVPGTSMLLHQAAAQVRLMTGREAPLQAMRDALAEALA